MKSRFNTALRLLAGILPATLAAAGLSSTALAAHDDGVVRTVGAGFTGVFRALDLLVAAPMMLAPFGTRSLRAGLASAIVIGICGACAFDIARALVARAVTVALGTLGVRDVNPSPQLLSAVAAVSVLTAMMSPAWQLEASAPGGSVTGALIVLLALRAATAGTNDRNKDHQKKEISIHAAAFARKTQGRWPTLALLVGLAASYEPLTLVTTLAAIAPTLALATRATYEMKKASHQAEKTTKKREKRDETQKRKESDAPPEAGAAALDEEDRLQSMIVVRSVVAFLLGLAPIGLGALLMRRPPELALSMPAWQLIEPSGYGGASRLVSLPAFALAEMGTVLLILCGVGAVLSIYAPGARKHGAALVLVVFSGSFLAITLLHAPAGPSRFDASVLVAIAGAYMLGGTMLGALVIAISRARVPFAEASAALVVVLELVLPIKAIDETTTRRDAHVANAAAIWNDVAWGAVPPASVVLVADRMTMRRIASARAAGEMRGDLVIVPSFDVQGEEGQHALIAEPKLAPLYRDMALGVPPEELSLAQLAAQRAVLANFDPKWDRALSRHLVPVGLTSRFEPEPRGASDRKRALDAFTPSKDRLSRVTVVRKDPELAAATTTLLRARAIGMAATGERDILSRALDDLRTFAPDDPIGVTLVRRILTSKGPIDVHDLSAAP